MLHYAPPYGVLTQSTLPFDTLNFREPDFVVMDAPLEEREARPDEIALIVEVSDSSLRYDLGTKARAYAAWGAPDYWVVDVAGRRVVAHSQPGPDGYARVEALGPGRTLTLPRLEVAIEVVDLLPPPGR